jgi:rhamnose utilization protein RhaD (predicted bifunctional aldolase and dehydrogenase)
VLTPEHIIRTKRTPLVLGKDEDISAAIAAYKKAYKAYFERYATDEVMLDPAPNYAVIEGVGVVTFGKSEREASVMADIVTHTMQAVLRADRLGGYQSIGEAESFAMEYWELEQAKLKRQG